VIIVRDSNLGRPFRTSKNGLFNLRWSDIERFHLGRSVTGPVHFGRVNLNGLFSDRMIFFWSEKRLDNVKTGPVYLNWTGSFQINSFILPNRLKGSLHQSVQINSSQKINQLTLTRSSWNKPFWSKVRSQTPVCWLCYLVFLTRLFGILSDPVLTGLNLDAILTMFTR